MFVQMMEGKVSDAAGLRRQMDQWETELRPGATGFLGATGGVSSDGTAFMMARFDSPESAEANSSRPEQGEWWAETEKCFDGPVTFAESTDVDLMLGGGSDEAGFVQVMKGSTPDREQLEEMDEVFSSAVADWRPDILGGVRVWTGADTFVQIGYFSSEAEAREGEQKEPPAELAARFEGADAPMADMEFMDLTDPMIS